MYLQHCYPHSCEGKVKSEAILGLLETLANVKSCLKFIVVTGKFLLAQNQVSVPI